MTGSWTIDAFIIGCIVLIIVPVGIWLYQEVFKNKGRDSQ